MADWRNKAQISEDVVSFNYRTIKELQYLEEVYVWDLDKTYLDTKFETFKGLMRTILEKGYQKRNVPGTSVLVNNLQRSWRRRFERDYFPIYFITASPPQLEEKIIEKLNFDSVQPSGIFCKDNLKNLKPKRLWRLTKQVGYKLQALLELRVQLAEDVRQVCWGDDSESDAIIYSLYSDICSRRLDQSEIERILKVFSVGGPQLETIFKLQSLIPKQDPLEKYYINLAEDTDAEYYMKFGRRCVPTYNSFQGALDLFQENRLNEEEVLMIAEDMIVNYGFTADELEKSLDDLIRRKVIVKQSLELILPALQDKLFISKDFTPSVPATAIAVEGDGGENEGVFEPWVPERIDYLHDYR